MEPIPEARESDNNGEENSKEKPKYVFKVLIVGPEGSGKTAIVNRYVNKGFHNYRPTRGFHLLTREIQREDCDIILNIIDVSGSEGTSILRGSYYTGCTGVFLVYDTTKLGTFAKTVQWAIKIRKCMQLPGGRPVPSFLLLNKCDEGFLSASAEFHIRTVFCYEHDIVDAFRTSAKTKTKIEDAFDYLIKEMLKNVEATKCVRDARDDPLVLEDPEVRKTDIRRKRWWHV